MISLPDTLLIPLFGKEMKKNTLRRLSIFAIPAIVLGAVVTIVPGIEYQFGSWRSVGLEKRSSGLYNTLRVYLPHHTAKYEWSPLATNDPCWGTEGFTFRPSGFYFRLRSFELSASKR